MDKCITSEYILFPLNEILCDVGNFSVLESMYELSEYNSAPDERENAIKS